MQEKSSTIITEIIISETNVTCHYMSKQEKVMECINGEFPVRISIYQGLVIIEIKVGKRYAVYAHMCIVFSIFFLYIM